MSPAFISILCKALQRVKVDMLKVRGLRGLGESSRNILVNVPFRASRNLGNVF